MRRNKVVVILDLEIEDDFNDQDMADVFNQTLNCVEEMFIKDLVVVEIKNPNDTEALIGYIGDEIRSK